MLPVLLVAQDAVVPGAEELPELPKTMAQYWVLGIAAVTPLIVKGIKLAVPKVPKVLLPSITPLIGMGLGAALSALDAADLSWWDSAQAGALAVFVRETINQAVKSRQSETPTPPTPTS